jgi:predicted nucleic acid-binding protein
MYFFLFKSYVFDFWNWYFYEKRFEKKLFEYANNSKYQNKVIPLKNIHALQLLAETVSWWKNHSSYISYELNIILKDSTRINIVDHWDLKQLKKDAKKIADKLKIKIYDVTDFFV